MFSPVGVKCVSVILQHVLPEGAAGRRSLLNVCVCPQLAQSVIELNNQIQQKDKEIQSNEAKSVALLLYLLMFYYLFCCRP